MPETTLQSDGAKMKPQDSSAPISCGPALEQAFALLSDRDFRVDSAESSTPAQDWVAQAGPLIEKISQQMISLNEQRDRLTQLLEQLCVAEEA